MTYEEFCKSQFDGDNLFPKGIDAQEAINILWNHFLGESYYINYPASNNQANAEFVGYMLDKYRKPKKNKRFTIFKHKQIKD